jgi:hypothetical protein
MNKAIKTIYTVFIGILFAIFVGVGISAFYEEPKSPDYPSELSYPVTKERTASDEKAALEMQKAYDVKIKDYGKAMKYYNRNVSIIATLSAVIILVVSIVFMSRLLIISDGLLIGGILTLGYSIIRGFDTEGNIFRFLVVSVGLVTALVLGYIKFLKQENS